MDFETAFEDLQNLPLLRYVATFYPQDSLKGVKVLCIQHLVATSYTLMQTLLQLGLQKEDLFIIGKCYSTHPYVFKRMRSEGFQIADASIAFEYDRSFDEQFKEKVLDFVLEKIKEGLFNNCKKLILLDDGGVLLTLMNQLAPQMAPKGLSIVGVEQTTSGIYQLSEQTLEFPIINVARSYAKLKYESPIIAHLVTSAILRNISEIASSVQNALIIGKGAIGHEIYAQLMKHYPNMSTFDIDPTKSLVASEHFEASLQNFDLIIGCTGKTVLTSHHYPLLKKNAVLISASSSDREFNATFLRKQAPPPPSCHAHVNAQGIHLINCGFPINFDAEYNHVDVKDIQLTRALLMLGVLQAAQCPTTVNRFVELELTNQLKIIAFYKAYVRSIHGQRVQQQETKSTIPISPIRLSLALTTSATNL